MFSIYLKYFNREEPDRRTEEQRANARNVSFRISLRINSVGKPTRFLFLLLLWQFFISSRINVRRTSFLLRPCCAFVWVMTSRRNNIGYQYRKMPNISKYLCRIGPIWKTGIGPPSDNSVRQMSNIHHLIESSKINGNFSGIHGVAPRSTVSRSNWNLEMLVFVEGGNPE